MREKKPPVMKRMWHIESGDFVNAARARREFAAYIKQAAAPESDCQAAVLIFSELVANALTHGRGAVRSCLTSGDTCAILWVEDAGQGFALEQVEQPAHSQVGGRGIFIAQSLARSIRAARIGSDRFRITVELPIRFAMP
jgi:anti-sigma regulatory factor (Ser/Thr protein kinase)